MHGFFDHFGVPMSEKKWYRDTQDLHGSSSFSLFKLPSFGMHNPRMVPIRVPQKPNAKAQGSFAWAPLIMLVGHIGILKGSKKLQTEAPPPNGHEKHGPNSAKMVQNHQIIMFPPCKTGYVWISLVYNPVFRHIHMVLQKSAKKSRHQRDHIRRHPEWKYTLKQMFFFM